MAAKTPKNHRQAWTAAEEKEFRKEAKQNTPTPLIAYKHGRTENAIRAKAQDLSLSLKPTNKPPRGTSSKKSGSK